MNTKVISIGAVRYNVFSPFQRCNAAEGLLTRKDAELWIKQFKQYCLDLKDRQFPYPLVIRATVSK